jgi:hypothetical protein
VPSASAVFRYLAVFHDAEQEGQRTMGRACIPEPTEPWRGLERVKAELLEFAPRRRPPAVATLDQTEPWRGLERVKAELLEFAPRRRPPAVATLDQDATVIETHQRHALASDEGYKAYQPLNTYWHEQAMGLHCEFRDGNVPAGYQQWRVLPEALEVLPSGIDTVYRRSDTVGYQPELRRYGAEGKHPRFRVIEFAIGVDVTPAFKAAVAEVAAADWPLLYASWRGIRSPPVKSGPRSVMAPVS